MNGGTDRRYFLLPALLAVKALMLPANVSSQSAEDQIRAMMSEVNY